MITKRNALFAVGTVLGGTLAGLGLFDAEDSKPTRLQDWQISAVHLENSQLQDKVEALELRIATLEGELSWSEDYRFRQEQEFLLWQEVISSMDPQGVLRKAGILSDPDDKDSAEQSEPEAPDPARVRAEEIGVSVGNLMASEGLHSLDLLESGRLEMGSIGPVVFRMLDDRGRLVGSLTAKNMHFEASVTARTVTMILEDGYESHGGQRASFVDRRLPFSFVDPWPWIEAIPELFPDLDAGQATPSGVDDGTYDLDILRRSLNHLLKADGANGYYGIKHIDGVRDEVLRGLHLIEYSSQGFAVKHMFADSATVSLGDRGVSVLLEDGASMRGDEKTAFLRGRFRIFLPNAIHVDWKTGGVPGIGSEEQ